MLQNVMSRFSPLRTVRTFVAAVCLSLLWGVVAHATPPARTAAGLIIGLKAGILDAPAAREDRGPWASDRVQMQAQWERAARSGRDHVGRIARDAGLPMQDAGEAGNAQLLRFDHPLRGEALDNALRRARLHPDVAWVEPDVLVPRLAVNPDDLLIGQQWHLQAPDGASNFSGLNMPPAWSTTTGDTGGPGVVVAVVDSGVLAGHPELSALGQRLLPGYDLVSELSVANDGNGRDPDPSDPGDWVSSADLLDPLFAGCKVAPSSWHGTFIAGQLAASTDNAQGIAGLNWSARLLPVRVGGKCGALVSDLLDGLRWAAGLPVSGLPENPDPARVINLSFGGDAPCSPAYQSTIDAVTNEGALVVVAAGNKDTTLTRPADCRRVMAVTSVRKDGAKADYASFGGRVALAAPGGSGPANSPDQIFSIDNAGVTAPGADIYGYRQGTSFAAPQAVGVASLMLAVNPSLRPRQLIERMKAGARPHVALGGLPSCGTSGAGPCNCTTDTCGAGLLDAWLSVQLASGPAAVIAPLEAVNPGAVIALDGRQSAPIPGVQIVSYFWSQIEGPPVVITPEDASLATVQLDDAEAVYVFRLTVRDSAGQTGQDEVRVMAMDRQSLVGAVPEGGGGASSLWWGAGLWLWLGALVMVQRRQAV